MSTRPTRRRREWHGPRGCRRRLRLERRRTSPRCPSTTSRRPRRARCGRQRRRQRRLRRFPRVPRADPLVRDRAAATSTRPVGSSCRSPARPACPSPEQRWSCPPGVPRSPACAPPPTARRGSTRWRTGHRDATSFDFTVGAADGQRRAGRSRRVLRRRGRRCDGAGGRRRAVPPRRHRLDGRRDRPAEDEHRLGCCAAVVARLGARHPLRHDAVPRRRRHVRDVDVRLHGRRRGVPVGARRMSSPTVAATTRKRSTRVSPRAWRPRVA